MELEIVDRASRQLTSAASEILAAMADGAGAGEPRKAKHELMESTILVVTVQGSLSIGVGGTRIA